MADISDVKDLRDEIVGGLEKVVWLAERENFVRADREIYKVKINLDNLGDALNELKNQQEIEN